jgi:hypothetical protein
VGPCLERLAPDDGPRADLVLDFRPPLAVPAVALNPPASLGIASSRASYPMSCLLSIKQPSSVASQTDQVEGVSSCVRREPAGSRRPAESLRRSSRPAVGRRRPFRDGAVKEVTRLSCLLRPRLARLLLLPPATHKSFESSSTRLPSQAACRISTCVRTPTRGDSELGDAPRAPSSVGRPGAVPRAASRSGKSPNRSRSARLRLCSYV